MRWRPRLLALSTALLVGAGALVGGAANAIGQSSLNTQRPGKPDELLTKLKTSLAKQGYSEGKINTVVGPWGFNLVLDPLSGTKVDGTAIGPNQLNLNVRFEGL